MNESQCEKQVKSMLPNAYCAAIFDGDDPPVVIGWVICDSACPEKEYGPPMATRDEAWREALRNQQAQSARRMI